MPAWFDAAMIPSETRWFALGSLALATNQPDEAVWARQRPEWLHLLMTLHQAGGPQPEPPLSELLKLPLGTEVPG